MKHTLKRGIMVWFHGVGNPKKAQVVNVAFDDNVWIITIRTDNGRLVCAPRHIAPLSCWNGHYWRMFEWEPLESQPGDCLRIFDEIIKTIAIVNNIDGSFVTHAVYGEVIAEFDGPSFDGPAARKHKITITHDNLIIKSIKVTEAT